jgi:hypothetical protein
MPDLFPFLLFLHVLGAIVAIGPTFAFPLIGAMGAREPQHANFAVRLSHHIEDRIVVPIILSTAVTGVALIWIRSLPVFEPAYRWLLISVLVYAAALSLSFFVQRRTIIRIIGLTGGRSGPTIPALASPGPGAPGAPPPELAGLIRRTQRMGMILTLLSLVIVYLMVVKPAMPF